MKSKHSTTAITPVRPAFPFLAQCIDSEKLNGRFVVLFTGETKGVVVQAGSDSGCGLGEVAACLYSCWREDKWRILPLGEQVVLSNG